MTTDRARSGATSGSESTAHPRSHRPPVVGHRAGGHVAPALQLKEAAVGSSGDGFEKEADQAAEHVVQGRTAPALSGVTPQALQRMAEVPAVSPDELAEGGGLAQPLFDEEATEEEPVQAKAAGSSGSPSTVDLPATGAGRALAPAPRAALESGFGTDLGAVRVHDDSGARNAADRMGAKAFTHGTDISLGSGQSADDVGLLAHEAAHVVQQAGGSGAVAQRNETTDAAPAPAAAATVTDKTWPDGAAINTATSPRRVTLGSLQVPATKRDQTSNPLPTDVPVGRDRHTTQSTKWAQQLRAATRTAAETVLAKPEVLATKDENDQFFLVNPVATNHPVVVSTDSLATLALRPTWDKSGVPTRFHVDHRVEYQLGGADEPENYWLLEEQANMSSGSSIANLIAEGINNVFTRARGEGVANVPADVAAARGGQWKFSVASISTSPLPVAGRETSNWTKDEVEQGDPVLDHLRAMTTTEMQQAGGTADELVLFLGPEGGARAPVAWGAAGATGVKEMPGWWFHLGTSAPGATNNNFRVDRIRWSATADGAVEGKLFKANRRNKGVITEVAKSIPIKVRPQIPWSGFLDKQRFLNEARTELSFTGLSPIELEEMDLDSARGLVARGRLLPTVPLISEAEVDVVIEGDNVYLSKVFTTDDFSFPGPIEVGTCNLELRFGTQGFEILGEAGFQVQGLGTGRVFAQAGANTEEVAFALGGEFNFLSDLFDPARVELWYRDGEFGGRGTLGIPEGRVNGLRSANATVEWAGEQITATGTFATEIPGVESGTLAFAYRPDGTVELGGTLNLGSQVPGISSGSIEAQLVRNPEGGWKVFGRIRAVPAIPGVASEITGTYDDGAIQMEASVAYERGMAAGQFTVGVSNCPLDSAGQPAGDPGPDLTAYGGGQVALTLAPWLRATAGLRLLPSGEIEVSGEIALPSTLEVFAQRSVERELFRIGLDIPIVGLAVAGQRVGIFATIAGAAQLRAYFGPAELREVRLGVVWNPDRQEETTVTGHAALHLPAGAGVRLSVSAALGAGIPLVSARLGLEIGGQLGIEAVIGASLDVAWTPTTGLVLETVAEAYAEPVFRFDITGFASVDLDLLLRTINLYEQRWELAAFEYGSGLRLGMRLPITYREGEPFEPSLSDVEFEVPDIDPGQLLSGLVDRLT